MTNPLLYYPSSPLLQGTGVELESARGLPGNLPDARPLPAGTDIRYCSGGAVLYSSDYYNS